MRRAIIASCLIGATLVFPLSATATTNPCSSPKTATACLASLPSATDVTRFITAAHATKALPTTSPTLSYLASATTGARSYFMPSGRCNQVAQMSNTSPPSIKDCTFGNAKATSAHTIFLTGDSRAVMWVTALAALATEINWRLVVMAKPGCVAQTGQITELNEPSRSGPWIACDTFRTAVASDLASLKPGLVIVSSNPVASLADGRQTGKNPTLAHDITLSYLQNLKTKSTASAFVSLNGFPLLVSVVPGITNPVQCLSAHKSDIRACDIKSNNAVGDDPVDAAVSQAALDAGYTNINQKSWLCDTTCPAVINKMIPYDRDGMHINNTYATSLMGVMWRALAAVPNSGIPLGS